MPRVHHVKKAQKDQPGCGVKAGESYYWWKNRAPGQRGGYRRCSKTPPRKSQITGSPFWSQVYGIQEAMEGPALHADDLDSLREATIADIAALRDEVQGSFDNMPEGLQSGPTGELLEERIYALETWESELEAVEIPDRETFDTDEEYTDALEAALTEMQAISPECS